MSLTSQVLVGVVRGVAGPDLAAWLDDLPGKLGEEIGVRIRDHLLPTGLSPAGLKELERWAMDNPAKTPELFRGLVHPSKVVPGEESPRRLKTYADTFNIVVKTLRTLRRSLVLQGFLHCETCLVYWQVAALSSFDQLSDFAPVHSSLATDEHLPEIHVIKEAGSTEELRDLNKAIRRSKFRNLDFDQYPGAVQVGQIRGSQKISASNTLIPYGAGCCSSSHRGMRAV